MAGDGPRKRPWDILYGSGGGIADALAQPEEPTPASNSPAAEQSKAPFSSVDFLMFFAGGLIAEPLCVAGWDAIVSGDHLARGTAAVLAGLGIGAPVASFHWWKDRIGTPARNWLPTIAIQNARVLAFAYFLGPAIYRRAVKPETDYVDVLPTQNSQSQISPQEEIQQQRVEIKQLQDELNNALHPKGENKWPSIFNPNTPLQPQSLPSDVAKIASLQSQLDDANAKIRRLSNQPAGAAVQGKSPILGVDEADKFRLVKTLRDNMVDSHSERITCHTMTHAKRSDWAGAAWGELAEIIGTAGWELEGGRTQDIFFRPGFTIEVSSDSGSGFTCGYRLSQMLSSLGVQQHFLDKEVTPDLVACEKENPTHGCVSISVGDEH